MKVVRAAWRCPGCNELIYSRDAEGRPIPGAPAPKFYSLADPEVCTTCYDAHEALDKRMSC